jgi:N-acetylglucosamine-6-phosphate deacetylase
MITDGVHLHPALYRDVTSNVGPDRIALITDAMAAAGMADGAYRLGALDVDVRDGVARVAGTDTIAGSTATMDQVFRFAVLNSARPRDEALLVAVRQSSVNPARALGLPPAGLAPQSAADLVVLDAALTVTGVLQAGSWVVQPG